jgi:hypothetical protein
MNAPVIEPTEARTSAKSAGKGWVTAVGSALRGEGGALSPRRRAKCWACCLPISRLGLPGNWSAVLQPLADDRNWPKSLVESKKYFRKRSLSERPVP